MSTPRPPRHVPVVILTGFLGSGKTSLLNRLMQARPQVLGGARESAGADALPGDGDGNPVGKLAVVVNEFGEVGIDGDLLPPEMTRQVEIPDGCICCILNDDLDATLLSLLDSTPDVEMIVIETTGIAEPMPICWALEREPLNQRVRLSAVITVVDALHFEGSRELTVGVDAQVQYADVLVLSKLDLVGGSIPQPVLDSVRELNPDAPVITGTPEQIAATLWQSIVDPALPEASQARRAEHGHRSHHDHEAHEHDDEDAVLASAHGFETIWLPVEETIDFEELSAQLEELPGNWVRIKGIAYAIDESTGTPEPRWVAFHRVGTRVSYEPLSGPAPGRVVALGMNLDRARLAACFAAAVVPWEE
ncbi:CobW family GTP-binding protein [Haliangium sp.]|uniref:CobW family GTP-binding protein n=1 Tax=Haliangium sp. TaxID=2663208 RepID=UPI003D12A7FD